MAKAGYGYQPLGAEGVLRATSVAADLRRGNNFLFMPVGGEGNDQAGGSTRVERERS